MDDLNGKPRVVNFSPSEANKKTSAGAWLPSIQAALVSTQWQRQEVAQKADWLLICLQKTKKESRNDAGF